MLSLIVLCGLNICCYRLCKWCIYGGKTDVDRINSIAERMPKSHPTIFLNDEAQIETGDFHGNPQHIAYYNAHHNHSYEH